jgi:hypothetical protein
VQRPNATILVLISDLMEGGDELALRRRAASLVAVGISVIALLALSDDGAPAYDHDDAQAFALLGIPTFACIDRRGARAPRRGHAGVPVSSAIRHARGPMESGIAVMTR